jgi:hypothetical protein
VPKFASQSDRTLQHGLKHGRQLAGGRVDNPHHLGGRGLARQSLVTLGFALGKLTFEIGYALLGIG